MKTGQAELPPGVTIGAALRGEHPRRHRLHHVDLRGRPGLPGGPAALAAAKLGILAASAVSGVIGFVVLKLILARTPAPRGVTDERPDLCAAVRRVLPDAPRRGGPRSASSRRPTRPRRWPARSPPATGCWPAWSGSAMPASGHGRRASHRPVHAGSRDLSLRLPRGDAGAGCRSPTGRACAASSSRGRTAIARPGWDLPQAVRAWAPWQGLVDEALRQLPGSPVGALAYNGRRSHENRSISWRRPPSSSPACSPTRAPSRAPSSSTTPPTSRATAQLDRLSDFLPGGPGWSAQPNRAVTFATFALDRAVAGNDPSFHRAVNLAIHLAARAPGPGPGAGRLPGAPPARLRARAAGLGGRARRRPALRRPPRPDPGGHLRRPAAGLARDALLPARGAPLRALADRAGGRAPPDGGPGIAYAGALARRPARHAVEGDRLHAAGGAAPPRGRPLRRAVEAAPGLGLVPFAATMALIPATLLLASAPARGALQAEPSSSPPRVQTAMSRLDYLLTQFTVIVRYLGLLVFPVGQTVDHDVPLRHVARRPGRAGLRRAPPRPRRRGRAACSSPRRPPARPLDPAAAPRRPGDRLVLPRALGRVEPHPHRRPHVRAPGLPSLRRALHLRRPRSWPSARAASRPTAPRPFTAAAGLLLAAVLGVVTWKRNEAWSSEVALWTDAVDKSPPRPAPATTWAWPSTRLGRRAEAMALLQDAVRLDPAYAQGHESLGVALGGRRSPGRGRGPLPARHRARPEGWPRPGSTWGPCASTPGRYAEAIPLPRAGHRAPTRTTPTPTPTWAPAGTASGVRRRGAGAAGGPRRHPRSAAGPRPAGARPWPSSATSPPPGARWRPSGRSRRESPRRSRVTSTRGARRPADTTHRIRRSR